MWARFEGPASDRERLSARLVEIARRQLRAELDGSVDRMRIRIEEGDPAEVILRAAREQGSDLLVTGVARNESLGRFTLGKTVDRLLREAEPAILVVNDRALAPYRLVVVAVDFSPASRVAVNHALALFPGRRVLVFHAYDIPYASFTDARDQGGNARLGAIAATRAFLEEAVPAREERDRLDVIVERGDPAEILRELGRKGGVELVVLGTNPRGVVLGALLGSVARRIVATLPCDALVVRAATPAPAPSAST